MNTKEQRIENAVNRILQEINKLGCIEFDIAETTKIKIENTILEALNLNFNKMKENTQKFKL
jgi:hypothetical protein